MFEKFFPSEFSADLYVDLGTANTLIVDSRKGLILNEPSVVAYMEGTFSRTVVAVGFEAKEKIGKTSGRLVASHPLKDGVVADLDLAESMLSHFLKKAANVSKLRRPHVVVSLPYGVTYIEKRAVERAGLSAGARKVTLIEEPMAAAVGSGMDVRMPQGNMIIDIGGGTTEVAVISLCGIVHCEAVRVGGHAFDHAIVEYVKRRYNVAIGYQTAERVKIAIGSAIRDDFISTSEVRGMDSTTGLPRSLTISSNEIGEAIESCLNEIVMAGRRALENTPPDLIRDILNKGAIIAGGGALLKRIDERLMYELKIPIFLEGDPLTTIARGGAKIIKDPTLLERVQLL